jgi:hypothetical protein
VSTLRARLFDRNRYTKKYPFVRAPKRETYMGTQTLAIELGTLTFENETEKVFIFEVQFPDTTYTVVAMPRDSKPTADGSAMVSLAVEGSTVDRKHVTIKASAPFTGQVDVMAIKVG